jgi:hypothetical protein
MCQNSSQVAFKRYLFVFTQLRRGNRFHNRYNCNIPWRLIISQLMVSLSPLQIYHLAMHHPTKYSNILLHCSDFRMTRNNVKYVAESLKLPAYLICSAHIECNFISLCRSYILDFWHIFGDLNDYQCILTVSCIPVKRHKNTFFLCSSFYTAPL